MILRGGILSCVILMTEMVLEGESYEKSCWKWSRNHTGTTDWSMVLGGDSYDSYGGTTDWV